jgi:NOL1/NOP2/fmu family ribosome biogenesis protein
MPHRVRGEGHFCAVLEKSGSTDRDDVPPDETADRKSMDALTRSARKHVGQNDNDVSIPVFQEAFAAFCSSTLSSDATDALRFDLLRHLRIYNGHVYTFNTSVRIPDHLRVAKKGFYLGEVKRVRDHAVFEPSHALVLSLNARDFNYTLSFGPDDALLAKYLKGETLLVDASLLPGNLLPGAMTAVCVDTYPLGWAKYIGNGMFKNHYPKGWRRPN